MQNQVNIIEGYIDDIIKQYKTGDAREHSYRPAFKKLIESIVSDIQAINEPAYTGGNAPDFLFKNGDIPISYAECKDVTIDVAHKEVQKQANRYVEAFGKILLTNYLEFQILDEAGEVAHISIAVKNGDVITPKKDNFGQFINLIRDYITSTPRTINSAKKLAQIMAGKGRLLRDNTLASLTENKKSEIYEQYKAFKEVLIHDLSEHEFADMYAQTLVYGLFVARYFDETLTNFSRHEAYDLLPSTNPLLKKFFGHIAGTDYDPKIAWMVDSLVEAYKGTNIRELMHREFEKKQKDPILHFYETFLTEYDKDLRKSRGVYYTPEPVVSFIVRSVDQILKSKFNLLKGLADTSKIEHEFKMQGIDGRTKDGTKKNKKQIHKVQILDPAVGTGTFLNEVIHEIYNTFKGQEGQWESYIKEDLLPRLHGFELMMASYTMAHLKLGVTLKELDYNGQDERLSVWLTNSLDESVHEIPNLFMSKWLTQESNEASRIKSEMPIMVVLGNPPYSGESFNKNYHEHDIYKTEPGGSNKLQEKNSKWLNDDYVKFIRFAENMVEKSGEGVVSMITAHGYIDNPTFRGMRWHLRKTFDAIYIVDLHGNSNRKETTLSGGKDENVFNIKTGVSIIFGVKKSHKGHKKLATVFKFDLYGFREEKFVTLSELNFETIKWTELPEETDLWVLEGDGKVEYQKGFIVSELFPVNSVGIVTAKDKILVNDSKKELLQNVSEFYNIESENSFVKKVSYRPFDDRFIYFDTKLIERSREGVSKNILKDNLSFVVNKTIRNNLDFYHIFLTKNLADLHLFETANASLYFTPLYIYTEQNEKMPNLDIEIWDRINNVVGETEPEDVLDYIYATLHSPNYREKYKEFLKIDFPRVPYPKDKKRFEVLVALGRELRELHLLESPKVNKRITTYAVTSGTNVVEKILYKDNKVFINDDKYFGNVPEIAWNFYIGGYQPAQKWLKDRKGCTLTNTDIEHYQKIIVVLVETDRIMKEIDKI